MNVRNGLWIAALALLATPALAQTEPDSEKFLTAVREQDGTTVNQLVDSAGSRIVNSRGFDGSTPLTVAVRQRSATYTKFLLGKGADANVANRDGDTPLILATTIGWLEGVDTLLDYGAKIDGTNRGGETALIVAVNARNPRLAKRLLEKGANPDIADHLTGYSARDYAKRDTRMPELARLIETVKKR